MDAPDRPRARAGGDRPRPRRPDPNISATVVGLTERTVQVIVADLEAADYLTRTRTGRRTRYTVNPESLARHPAQEGQRVGPFLSLLAAADQDAAPQRDPDDSEIGVQQTLCGWKDEFTGVRAISALAAQRGAEPGG